MGRNPTPADQQGHAYAAPRRIAGSHTFLLGNIHRSLASVLITKGLARGLLTPSGSDLILVLQQSEAVGAWKTLTASLQSRCEPGAASALQGRPDWRDLFG